MVGTGKKEEASSKANKSPPIGAPKAAEIPQAAPAVIKSLTSFSYFKVYKSYFNNKIGIIFIIIKKIHICLQISFFQNQPI